MSKVTIYSEFWADNYTIGVALAAKERGYLRYDEDLDDYVLLTDWEDIDRVREELRASKY